MKERVIASSLQNSSLKTSAVSSAVHQKVAAAHFIKQQPQFINCFLCSEAESYCFLFCKSAAPIHFLLLMQCNRELLLPILQNSNLNTSAVSCAVHQKVSAAHFVKQQPQFIKTASCEVKERVIASYFATKNYGLGKNGQNGIYHCGE